MIHFFFFFSVYSLEQVDSSPAKLVLQPNSAMISRYRSTDLMEEANFSSETKLAYTVRNTVLQPVLLSVVDLLEQPGLILHHQPS